jgi:hypothetical protein
MGKRALGNVIAATAAALTLTAASAAVAATIVTQEPPAGQFRPGMRILVDDGSCPAGQIKEIVDLTSPQTAPGQRVAAVKRIRHCIRRERAL